GQLDHPGIVPVHDLGIDPDGRCYFTMRLVRGRELKEILKLAREGKEGWTQTRALGVILKVCEAMAFAHSKSVIHRDLKPANIMVGRFGETYVMDWGLARVAGKEAAMESKPQDASSLSIVRTDRRDSEKDDPDSPLVTLDGDVVGTPSYMPLEQAQGDLANLGPRADIYALGSILYELLTGRVPYLKEAERVSAHVLLSRVLDAEPEPVAKLAKDQPAELVAICEHAMARDQEDRYPSMLAVAADIQAYLEDRVVKAYGGGAILEIRKWVRRNKGAAAALCALLLVALGSGIFLNIQASNQNEQTLRQLEVLATQEAKTSAARDEAQRNLINATESQEQTETALSSARASADEARDSAGHARRSSYGANLLAADYSMRLGNVERARASLAACEEEMRGWGWGHMELECNPPLRSRKVFPASLDRAILVPGTNRALVFARTGLAQVIDLDTMEDALDKPATVGPLNMSTQFSVDAWDTPARVALQPGGTLSAYFTSGVDVHFYDFNTDEKSTRSIEPWLQTLTSRQRGNSGEGRRLLTAVGDRNLTSMAWSPNGRLLAVGGYEGSIVIFDMRRDPDKVPLDFGANHRKGVSGLAWDPSGGRLASVSESGEFALWNLSTGRYIVKETEHVGAATAVVYDAGREAFLTCGVDGAILRWSAKDGKLEAVVARLREPLQALAVQTGTGAIAAVSSPEGKGQGGRCFLMEPVGGELPSLGGLLTSLLSVEQFTTRSFRGAMGGLNDVFFGPEGISVVAVGIDGYLLVWDLEGPLSTTELGPGLDPLAQRSALGGGTLALGWDGEASHGATSGSIDLEGHYAATGGVEGDVVLWDFERGFPKARLRGHQSPVGCVAFSPDGSLVASGSQDNTIRLWSTESASLVRVLRGHERWVKNLSFSGDGTRLFSTSGGDQLLLWDVESGQLLSSHEGHHYANLVSELSLDGSLVATASRAIIVRDSETLVTVANFKRSGGTARALCFSRDNRFLWAGYSNGALRKWSLETGELVRELKAENKADILGLVLSSDGSRLITSSLDSTIQVRDGEMGDVLLRLDLPEDARHITLSPDDSRLLVVLMSGRVLVLEAALDDHEAVASRRGERARERMRRERLRPGVFAQLAELAYPSEVRAAIGKSDDLSQAEQETSRSILDSEVDVPGYLAGRARAVARERASSAEELTKALFKAESAAQQLPDDPRIELVLGLVQFRADRAGQALETLSSVTEKARLSNGVKSLLGQEALLSGYYHLVLAMLELGATERLNDVMAEVDQMLASDPALRVRAYSKELRAEVDAELAARGF
ncbi:MAG: WD40 repeat protein/serine/threonine protein kinase, partial [Planctomycetota bacterium]